VFVTLHRQLRSPQYPHRYTPRTHTRTHTHSPGRKFRARTSIYQFNNTNWDSSAVGTKFSPCALPCGCVRACAWLCAGVCAVRKWEERKENKKKYHCKSFFSLCAKRFVKVFPVKVFRILQFSATTMAAHFFRTAFYATAARKSMSLPFAGRTAATLAVGLSFGGKISQSQLSVTVHCPLITPSPVLFITAHHPPLNSAK